ncbi:hypothetical protein GCM10009630_13000 [Kribbella jejuensis]|uniref:PknH-like protein n=2 Tax=Kribbella jejuensis TaxID=236068 RepID=A0A542E9F5_9ACTN|nr:hypothetical protein FB475_4887 [Kribbella jejuensis]
MIKPLAIAGTALVLTLTSCSGGSGGSAGPSPANSVTTTATPSPTPTATTATAPTTPTVAPPPVQVTRTAAQLTKALLALPDLPAGFSIDKDTGDDGPDVAVSSKDSRCARLVALTNADNPPGSKVSAGQSYSGGSQGPFVDESLDWMGSTAAVRALQQSFKKAITSCRSMTLTIPGEGRSPISVDLVSPPKAGTDPVAVRFSASGGPLDGLEVTMVTTGVDDVVLAVTVIAGAPEDIEGATQIAVTKAQKTLGARTGA